MTEWQGFFDANYLELWDAALPADRTEREAEGLWALLNLSAGSKVLDASCGYGRLSHVLATRGAGLVVRSTHAGCSAQPFASAGAPSSNRLGILAARE